MANVSGFDFITLLVRDLEASYRFYKEDLGLEESTERRPDAHAFSTRPIPFAIRQSADGGRIDEPGRGVILWLRASDSKLLHADLKKRGVTIVDDLRESPFGMTFSFRDPDGYVITVHDGG